MVTPLIPAIAVGILGLAAYLDQRRRGREVPALTMLDEHLLDATRSIDSVRTRHDGLPVVLSFDVPEGHPTWQRGLKASARYAMGAGPVFTATSRDISAHARPMGRGYPLSTRMQRGYDLVGEHREARIMLMPTLLRLDTSLLPAPLIVSKGETIDVHLPEFMPEAGDIDTVRQLIALTGELAFLGREQLKVYGDELGARLIISPTHEPAMFLLLGRGAFEAELRMSWQYSSTGVRVPTVTLRAPRAGSSEPSLEGVTRQLAEADRPSAERILSRSVSRVTAGHVELALASSALPRGELAVALAVLEAFAGRRQKSGPFR